MRKLINANFNGIRTMCVIGLSALLVVATGCGASHGEKVSSSSSSSSSVSLTLSSSPDSTSSMSSEAVSDNPTIAGNQSGNPDVSSQTQQAVLNQIHAALHTTVPLMLPTSVPVEKGYLTATTTSQTTNYKANLYETKQPTKINSQAASKGTFIATVVGTEYKNAASAKENITESGYMQVDFSNIPDSPVDLGHRIKAMAEGGAGHQQMIWNEGRWCVRMDSPSDPAFRNKEYPDRDQLAKDIVAYLEDHMLPAPQKIGVISIVIWNQDYGTTVQWQENQTVYQISSPDPMTALKVAVAMKSV